MVLSKYVNEDEKHKILNECVLEIKVATQGRKPRLKKKLIVELSDINRRIEREFCDETSMALTDERLLDKYKKCPSVIKTISQLNDVLSKYVDDADKFKILNECVLQLIPTSVKAVIRGNKFNEIIKKRINSFHLDKQKFDVFFEKRCDRYLTKEIPDWYILEKSTGKTIVGMNQVDLWGGGPQQKRGSRYVINNPHNTENRKLLCVVSNKIELKSIKSGTFNLFKVGFENSTLCYINNLQNIIYSYFNLK